jgi:cytochrome c-type biogenesis protein CcmF
VVAVAQRLAATAGLALLTAIVLFALSGSPISLAPLGLLLGFWVTFGAIAELIDRIKLGRIAPGDSLRRLIGLPRSAFSTALAHFGIGVVVLGIVATTAWESEVVTTLAPGQATTIAEHTVRFDKLDEAAGPNFTAIEGSFVISQSQGPDRIAVAERRVYLASGMETTEAAIETYGFSQLYLQLGEAGADGSRVVRLWYKPFVTLIWLGAILMAGAGLLSLSDRRLRVGVPRRRTGAMAHGPAE